MSRPHGLKTYGDDENNNLKTDGTSQRAILFSASEIETSHACHLEICEVLSSSSEGGYALPSAGS